MSILSHPSKARVRIASKPCSFSLLAFLTKDQGPAGECKTTAEAEQVLRVLIFFHFIVHCMYSIDSYSISPHLSTCEALKP